VSVRERAPRGAQPQPPAPSQAQAPAPRCGPGAPEPPTALRILKFYTLSSNWRNKLGEKRRHTPEICAYARDTRGETGVRRERQDHEKSETRVRPRRMSREQDTPAPPRPRSGALRIQTSCPHAPPTRPLQVLFPPRRRLVAVGRAPRRSPSPSCTLARAVASRGGATRDTCTSASCSCRAPETHAR
jgi:hypothetical protein